MYISFLSRTTQDNHVHEIDPKCHPSQRIKLAGDNGLNLRDAMLEVELIKVTVADLWTVIEPKQITNDECEKKRSNIFYTWMVNRYCKNVFLLSICILTKSFIVGY